jgi:hypothetical protein
VTRPQDRQYPPITALAVASMILVVIGGIYLAAFIPDTPPLALPTALLYAAAAVLICNLALVARLREFAWGRFRKVGGWALLAYIVTAGMIEFVFVLDGTPGPILTLLTGMLVIYAVDIPLLLAFTVARYQPAGS